MVIQFVIGLLCCTTAWFGFGLLYYRGVSKKLMESLKNNRDISQSHLKHAERSIEKLNLKIDELSKENYDLWEKIGDKGKKPSPKKKAVKVIPIKEGKKNFGNPCSRAREKNESKTTSLPKSD